jgi:hypothetical protein
MQKRVHAREDLRLGGGGLLGTVTPATPSLFSTRERRTARA